MAQNRNDQNDNGNDEYVDLADVQFVKRGRKPSLDEQLVQKLKGLPSGKALVLQSLKLNPAASTYANDKARVASAIRTACKAAGLSVFSIKWTPQGVPQVVR
jgi:hypothetical protein